MGLRLFEPATIGAVFIQNRIVMAAMSIGGLIEPDGRIGQRARDYYVARARGGVGLIITGSARVTREIEYIPSSTGYLFGHLGADSPAYINGLSELADAVHDHGAKLAVQLSPGRGRIAPLDYLSAIGAVSSSATHCFFDSKMIARELRTEEVERLVQAFGIAAEIARTAGVDAIELHAHNGHLLDQFQTALWNRRKDKYGGDLDGRLRLAIEIIAEIKKRAGKDFGIIYKFGLTHFLDGGRQIEEGIEITRRLERAGVDAFDIDAGCFETRYWATPALTQPAGHTVHLAAMVKKAVCVPVIAVGRLGYPDMAEQIVAEGKVDFVALGRQLLADPEWPAKVKSGRVEDIRPCIGCYEGCMGRIPKKYISCSVNPQTGMEMEFTLAPASKKKSVVIIGGGPAGMEAARVLAHRGHHVKLIERSGVLGGALIPASVPIFKGDCRKLLDYLTGQVRTSGVDVVLSTEATPEMVEGMNPDVVIVARGGTPCIPAIPGIQLAREQGKVVTGVDLLMGKGRAGNAVLIIGGGLIGCEIALYLGQKGHKVSVVEMLDQVGRDMYVVNRMHLMKLLADVGTRIFTETRVLDIAEDGICVSRKDGRKEKLKADTIVIATGSVADRGSFESLMKSSRAIFFIGDCVLPRRIHHAIWEGFRVGRLV